MKYPTKRSKALNEEIAECNTQKVSKRSMRKCWFRAAGLQKNTKTNRSHAGKFTKFGFRCSVPMQNSCLWTSVYTIAHGFCITLHQSTAFPSYASPLLLWQSPSIYMIELCFFSLDQWEIGTHLLSGKCFNIPHDCDPHLDQTKFNDLLQLTIHGVLAVW